MAPELGFLRLAARGDYVLQRSFMFFRKAQVKVAMCRIRFRLLKSPSLATSDLCLQILSVHDQAEKDEIVKSVMHLKNAEIEEGYTKEAVISRQNLLMDVRDKLLFEPEYAGNFKDKQPPKSSLKIPWAWLPGALCLLQEAGEEKLVLEIGRRALQHPESKPFVHDLLLSMALAEVRKKGRGAFLKCAIAKVGFEKNNISQGFEALARAQCLLRSKISLGKMMLLAQIEESLEELAPACTLDILGMPHTPENAERRIGAIAAMRELLRQGLDVETSCQVQDWPCFLNQALKKLMATEIVELISWDILALTRKNRKSLESQNQRIVIDFNSFYVVMLAHIALGFSSKQTELVIFKNPCISCLSLINKAKSICECLTASEGIDLKFEEAFCSFLLGQGDEATAVEKLMQLELNSNNIAQKSLQTKETREVSSTNKPLETWLKEAVLGLFPDTRDCSPSLADFFISEKRASGKRQNKRAPPAVPSIRHRPLAAALPLNTRDEEPVSCTEYSRHIGPAVKQLTPNLQNLLIEDKSITGNDVGSPSIKLKRILGANQGEVWTTWLGFGDVLRKIIYATALGCILVALFRLINLQVWRPGNGSRWRTGKQRIDANSLSWSADSTMGSSYKPATIKQNSITRKFKKVLSLIKMQSEEHPESVDLQTASLSSGLSSSIASTYRQPMPSEDAETLVKQWQAIKAEALGPNHDINGLFEALEGSMLVQWQALANAAKARSCFWRFVLLQLTVVRAEILKDGIGREIAEIEVLLEEAAELVDGSQPKNPTYYSPYKILYLLKRQDDGSWRFYEGDILTPS
ncbi:hypothetical protein RD792_014758 [Penstemon davidsonii]|uniref:ARC6 IMS domain-containing protein n=1 Tax=Penstemon davidsonii TaxID=160366 RepID=A0ABR0CQ81_9LAMI|nr:hypothetical protein RD792_014758 [Penstemon davidsonii]